MALEKMYFGSNLKMYKGVKDTVEYLQQLEKLTADINRSDIELFIIPSYTSLESASKAVDHDQILLGAQNMCWQENGQFTGEISPLMLKEVGMDMVMIGHSERRQIFRETDEEENRKVRMALKYNFTTLLCIGETEQEKSLGIATETLKRQLKTGLWNIPSLKAEDIRIAYEPVWSIGTAGQPATAEYAEKRHWEIKECLQDIFGPAGKEIPVLYGGSVNLQNAEELMQQPDIDGLFIGRAAWNAVQFNELIRKVLNGR